MINSTHKDYIGSKLGMWLFLFTEILLFGGLFILYSVYRATHSKDFHIASSELNFFIGTANTIILLTSSLFMALSIFAIQKNNKKLSCASLALTIILGCSFLVNKYFEWGAKFKHGYYPGSTILTNKKGENLFYGLYYALTGLHGLHVFVGILVLSIMFIFLIKEKIDKNDYVKLENSGLYWHLVDIIWIFLFPLFYLIS